MDTVTVDILHLAVHRLYEAELALHDAHASGVDAWIAAAADRLHEAVLAYEAANGFAHAA